MNLDCPNINYFDIIFTIKSHMRDKSMFENKSVMCKVLLRYFIYDYYARSHQLYTLPMESFEEKEKNFLLDLYSNHFANNKKEAYKYYEELFKHTKNGLCPTCALNKASELDHFLPKSKYPEFSIFLRNLIPICHNCNHLKNNNTSIRFLHSYYDDIDQFELLQARIEIREQVVLWNFYVQDGEFDYYYFRAYKDMFNFLRLGECYNMRATDEFMGFYITVKALIQNKGKSNRKILEQIINQNVQLYVNQFGQNYWKSVFYRTLLVNLDDIFNWECL